MPNYLDRIAGINWLENAPYIYDSLMTKARMLADPYTYHGKMTICEEDLYAYVCDLNRTPSPTTGYYRRLDVQSLEIVTEFPDLTDVDQKPTQDKAYWLVKDIMDGTEIKYPAGLYIYSLEDNEFTRPYEADDKLDLDAIFDNTLVAEYEGNKDNFVDGDYLYKTIKDLTRYIKPFHHLTLVDVDTVADMDVYLATAEPNAVYQFTVKEDETHTVEATEQHAEYDPETKYLVVAVEQVEREDSSVVPEWKKTYLGMKDLCEHPFAVVDELPDITIDAEKPNRDMTYWLMSDIMDGDVVKYPAGLYVYDMSEDTLTNPYAGAENGDANVWVDGKWRIQHEYGYASEVTDGRTTYKNVDAMGRPDGLSPFVFLPDADPVVVGKEYSVFVNGRFVGHGVAESFAGDPRVPLQEPFEEFLTEWGETGVSFTQDAADLGLVNYPGKNTVDIFEGYVDKLTDYVEFNRGYIPAPIRTYEKLEVIPENDIFKDGDLIYLTKQPMAQSIVRYKLSDAAAADGFEITDEGIYRDNYDDEPAFWRVGKRVRNGLSWEQLDYETLEEFPNLTEIDATNGTIWRVVLKSVSGEGMVKYIPSDTEITADMFVERATMKYDKENDEFVFVSTDAKFDCNTIPVAADNLEFYLPDNMYDFLD